MAASHASTALLEKLTRSVVQQQLTRAGERSRLRENRPKTDAITNQNRRHHESFYAATDHVVIHFHLASIAVGNQVTLPPLLTTLAVMNR